MTCRRNVVARGGRGVPGQDRPDPRPVRATRSVEGEQAGRTTGDHMIAPASAAADRPPDSQAIAGPMPVKVLVETRAARKKHTAATNSSRREAGWPPIMTRDRRAISARRSPVARDRHNHGQAARQGCRDAEGQHPARRCLGCGHLIVFLIAVMLRPPAYGEPATAVGRVLTSLA